MNITFKGVLDGSGNLKTRNFSGVAFNGISSVNGLSGGTITSGIMVQGDIIANDDLDATDDVYVGDNVLAYDGKAQIGRSIVNNGGVWCEGSSGNTFCPGTVDSCSGYKLNQCGAYLCPNVPGQCSVYPGGIEKDTGITCDCNGISACDTDLCTYDINLNRCVLDNSSCTLNQNIIDLSGRTFEAYCADNAGNNNHPHNDWNIIHFHAWCARAHHGCDKVNPTYEESNKLQRYGNKPQGRSELC